MGTFSLRTCLHTSARAHVLGAGVEESYAHQDCVVYLLLNKEGDCVERVRWFRHRLRGPRAPIRVALAVASCFVADAWTVERSGGERCVQDPGSRDGRRDRSLSRMLRCALLIDAPPSGRCEG